MAAEEVAVVTTIRSASRGSEKRLGQVDLNEVPTRAKGAGGAVGDKEETVGGHSDGSKEGSASSEGSWERRVIGSANRNGSGSRDQAVGRGKGKGAEAGPSVSVISWKVNRGGWSVGREEGNHILLYIWMLKGERSGCGSGE